MFRVNGVMEVKLDNCILMEHRRGPILLGNINMDSIWVREKERGRE